MDGSSDGSPSAAQSAQPGPAPSTSQPTTGQSVSFLDWALRRRRRNVAAAPRPTTELDRASAAGARQMLVNLRNMRDLRVQDVAIPRVDVVSVPLEISLEDLLTVFRDSGYSRIPVYEETLDNPLGLVHLKDVALAFGFAQGDESFDLMSLIRPLLFAPPSMPIGALLQKMQSGRMHMALVIDEYGGVDGLVTMEDLVEQIVGEIADEHDTEEADDWKEERPGVYRATARTDLNDFEEATGLDLLPDDLDEDVETLGGLVFMLANRVPARGEVVRHPLGHEFEVLDADARRIQRLRVRLTSALPEKRAAE